MALSWISMTTGTGDSWMLASRRLQRVGAEASVDLDGRGDRGARYRVGAGRAGEAIGVADEQAGGDRLRLREEVVQTEQDAAALGGRWRFQMVAAAPAATRPPRRRDWRRGRSSARRAGGWPGGVGGTTVSTTCKTRQGFRRQRAHSARRRNSGRPLRRRRDCRIRQSLVSLGHGIEARNLVGVAEVGRLVVHPR